MNFDFLGRPEAAAEDCTRLPGRALPPHRVSRESSRPIKPYAVRPLEGRGRDGLAGRRHTRRVRGRRLWPPRAGDDRARRSAARSRRSRSRRASTSPPRHCSEAGSDAQKKKYLPALASAATPSAPSPWPRSPGQSGVENVEAASSGGKLSGHEAAGADGDDRDVRGRGVPRAAVASLSTWSTSTGDGRQAREADRRRSIRVAPHGASSRSRMAPARSCSARTARAAAQAARTCSIAPRC